MKKKLHPKDQSRKLNKARLEFLKRNKHEFERFLADESCQRFLKFSEEHNHKQEDIDDVLSDAMGRPAVLTHHEFAIHASSIALVRIPTQSAT